ncbi:class I SAM-dependent methyltransferase [Proteiniphilum sp.]|uniref:class I SAM-dependent methyltransferase n=1 Tax=Proteiniphilum sp. TaxID=1926877 RepID=UPI002B20FF73|nr:class I SAM-dependent methyltransferase [Proteiniphilum sp.]MEA4919255.1 class I SAM-dependent methyltransferase [Proteiniphilum sp.]
MENDFLKQYIHNLYSDESIKEKRFYNIGAGSQRSKFDFWTYIDLETSKYSKKGIDIFYDLESLSPIPVPDDHAEVVFNSFVIEHISMEATKNLCREAFRMLKKGGVFHSKVHCYEYAYRLYNHKLISPKIPFECRESNELLDDFLKKYNGRVKAFFNDKNEYVFKSLSDSEELIFNAENSFIYHNATAALDNLSKGSSNIRELLETKDKKDIASFYENVLGYVDKNKKEPHQHNANYFSKEDLFSFMKDVGFSEVYFTQPYQSISPTLWEDKLNPVHMGFLFSIEAIK